MWWNVLRVLLQTAERVSGYPDTISKRNLWCAILAALGDASMQHHLRNFLFLNASVIAIELPRSMVIYTIQKAQLNVATMIPAHLPDGEDEDVWLRGMHDEAMEHVARAHPRCEGIKCSSLVVPFLYTRSASHILRSRLPRFVAKKDLPHLRLARSECEADGTELTLVINDNAVGAVCAHAALRTLERVRDLGLYRPLTTLCWNDPEDTVYWHRFPCGAMACFTNPIRAFTETPMAWTPIPLTTAQMAAQDVPFAPALAGLRHEAVNVALLRRKDIPQDVRAYLAVTWARALGITDKSLACMGAFEREYVERFKDMRRGESLLPPHERRLFVHMMAMSAHVTTSPVRAPAFFAHLERENWHADEYQVWSRWGSSSAYVRKCVFSFPTERTRPLLDKALFLVAVPLAQVLYTQRLQWTAANADAARALLERTGTSHGAFGVLARFMEEEAQKVAVRLCSKEKKRDEEGDGATPKKNAGRPLAARASGDAGDDGAEGDGAEEEVATVDEDSHVARAKRLAARVLHGWDVVLLGSGCFFEASDVDVAVCVADASSLEDAYEQVRARTGWQPRYAKVGERVAVLAGVFESVPVDAQVWRGESAAFCHTPAERMTHRAIQLTSRLTRQLAPTDVARVRSLHRWAHAATLKGQTRCRMPGVAVTVLAACAHEDTLRLALASLRDRVFARVAPRAVLGEGLADARAEYERPEIALDVGCDAEHRASSSSLCAQMTASTTRHVLDALAHALTLDDDALCSAAAYATWRARTMVVAARMRPRTADASACGVLRAVVALEGHPLIDAVHVEDEDGHVKVRCTLRDVCVKRYGFRKGDVVVRRDAWWATVRRGRREWLLALTERAAPGAAPGAAHSVRDLVAVDDDAAVANAPGLTSDVIAGFDPRGWTV